MPIAPNDARFDRIIVGAGTAGCVLASRLSERSAERVLLVEAGPDMAAGTEPADLLDPYPVALANPRLRWPRLTADVGPVLDDEPRPASRPFLQGFGVGGSSNIQGMIAFRGQPADYDEWRDRGAQGWGWDEVLRYFQKLERDLDFSGPMHGDRGPIPVRRVAPADWAPFAKEVGGALGRRGFPLIDDYNADFREGLSAVPMANLPSQRISASFAYLNTSARSRPNLTIAADLRVERLITRGRSVTGVEARTSAGEPRTYSARETIVSCGAVYSPALLLRSGIGPGDDLRALGIQVVQDLAGVGCGLQNHPKLELAVHLPRSSVQPRSQRAFGQNCLRYSSRMPGCGELDMGLVIINKAAWHALGRRIGALAIALYKPYSAGSVDIVSTDPAAAPRVCFNLFSDSRDFERLVGGLRFGLEVLADSAVAAVRNEVFFPNARFVSHLSRPTGGNAIKAHALAALLDFAPLRRAILKGSLTVDALLGDEGALREVVRRRAGLSHHVCGTCKMGRADDPAAVVDELGRVHGMEGLRVVDASIFPTIVRGNTHLPVLMVAEKMADHIKSS